MTKAGTGTGKHKVHGPDSQGMNTYAIRIDPTSVHMARSLAKMLPGLAGQVRVEIHRDHKDQRVRVQPEVNRHRPRGIICQECGVQSTVHVRDGRCLNQTACAKRAKEWR